MLPAHRFRLAGDRKGKYAFIDGLDTIAAGSNTNNMTTPVPLFTLNPSGTNPNYTRNGTTQFHYDWDAHGKITVIHGPSGCNVLS